MRPLVLTNITAILPDRQMENARIVCEAGRISRVEAAGSRKTIPKSAEVLDGRGGYVAPGFVDVHCHGGGGGDFMDGNTAAARVACQTHFRHGTTTLFPTTTTGSPEEIHAMIAACRAVGEEAPGGGLPRIPGIHLYGPFFAPDKVGAHPPEGRRDPAPAEYRGYFDTGFVRIATCAAELPGAEDFYREAKKRRCFITCGHSNASWTEMERAFRRGMRHVDHFWSAMSSVSTVRARLGTPMQGGMEEYVIYNAEMSTEVIADGEHLAPELLRFAHRIIGPRRLFLVTDSSRAVDMPPGRYKIGNLRTGNGITHDGRVSRTATGLGSSSMGMDHMVRTMRAATGAPLWEIVRMASLTPAERLGIDGETGSLAPGKRADLILLTRSLRVKRVWLGDPSPL